MLSKTNHMSNTKFLAVFFMGNQWPRLRILDLPRILLEKAGFVFLMKAQIT